MVYGQRVHYKNNYFSQPWTWFKRFLELMTATMFLYWVSIQEADQVTTYSWIKYILFGLLTVYIFIRPKDELAVDKENLYYIKRSIFPLFNRTIQYNLSKIKTIRIGGIFTDKTEIFGLVASGVNRNRIEITFNDNSSISHDMTIYKKKLEQIVMKIRGLINQNSA